MAEELNITPGPVDQEDVVLCGANSYEEKYYFNERFKALPQQVKDELKIMCVLFTEDCGGILTLEFLDDGTLILKTAASDYDFYYDEIESGVKIGQLRREKEELFTTLETYYKAFFLGKTD